MTETFERGHYKPNHEYTVVDVVTHSETEEVMLLYRAEYGDRHLWVRSIQNFCEWARVDGRSVERFELISPQTRV